MHRKANISIEIQETLDALHGIQRAETSPFFYTRLMAKLEKTDKSLLGKIFIHLAKPKVALSILILVLFLNAFFVFHLFKSVDEPASEYVAVEQISYLEHNNYLP